MPTQTFNPKNARLIVTSAGYIAVECSEMSAADQAELFGPEGVMPPQSLSTMLDDLFNMMLAAPDSSDAARLKSLANDLMVSHAKVETALAQLEQ